MQRTEGGLFLQEHNSNPEFSNSEIQLGKEQNSIISLNSSFVGEVGADGLRQIKAGEEVVIHLNGREICYQSNRRWTVYGKNYRTCK